ncbi:MAG: 30S ribosomal protein S18 [Patescibacteria group bacterium]|nr:30S ribosomal protein S18 [Patescibacteria group bacterium]
MPIQRNRKPQQRNNPEKVVRECYFCQNNINDIDYKDGQFLRRWLSSYCKIVPRRRSGVCTKHQRKLSQAIKRSRYMSLLPYTQR